ncbi:hypothetical protein [Allorhizobium undicola]|uniref:hypothetical protein n=1 Tax=Allorhizobium undicola TaxID=78527 RepID=UPI0012B5A4B9|nr:hypothetical protein [Allorhizobium undicola]
MTNKQTVASAGEECMVRIDAAGLQLVQELHQLTAIVEAGVSAGMARALKSKEIVHRAHELPGRVRGLLADVVFLHQDLSRICVANGCELRIPTAVAGVALSEAVTGVSSVAVSAYATTETATASLVTVQGGGDR